MLTIQEGLGGYGEEGSFPTASTAAAQQALAQSRQRRDERALDKGNQTLGQHAYCPALRSCVASCTLPRGALHKKSRASTGVPLPVLPSPCR